MNKKQLARDIQNGRWSAHEAMTTNRPDTLELGRLARTLVDSTDETFLYGVEYGVLWLIFWLMQREKDPFEMLALRIVGENGHGLMSRNGCFLRIVSEVGAQTDAEFALINNALNEMVWEGLFQERRPSGGGGEWLYITDKGRKYLQADTNKTT